MCVLAYMWLQHYTPNYQDQEEVPTRPQESVLAEGGDCV